MNKIRKEEISQKWSPVLVVGLLVTTQGAMAVGAGEETATPMRSEAHAPTQRAAQAADNRSAQMEFNEVDANSDNRVSWRELEQAYETEITKVGLTEDQFIKDFDRNRDLGLDEVEYRAFTMGFVDRQVYSAAEIEEQSSQQTKPTQWNQTGAPHPKQNTRATVAGTSSGQGQGEAATENKPSGQEALKPDSQLQQQKKEQQIQQDDTTVAIVGVTAVHSVPVEDIADRPVINLKGKNIGNVEDVVRTEDGATTGLLVSTGGFLGIGAKEVVIDVNEVHLTEEQVVWEETEEDAVDNLPEYDEKDYVSVR